MTTIPMRPPSGDERRMHLFDGRRVQLVDLVENGLLAPNDVIEFKRRKLGDVFTARITEAGEIELPDGQRFTSPSPAAIAAVGSGSFDGWHSWRVRPSATRPCRRCCVT